MAAQHLTSSSPWLWLTLLAASLAAGCGSSGGIDAPGEPGASSAGVGEVLVRSDPARKGPDAASPLTHAFAAFGHVASPPPACERTSVGPCVVEDCPGDVALPSVQAASAGAITITGGAHEVSLVPRADGSYEEASDDGLLWTGGELLTVSAAGGDAPAFSLAVPAPPPLIITEPVLSSSELELSADSDLALRWSTDAYGARLQVTLAVADADGRTVTASCELDAAVGGGAIPKAAIARLLPSLTGSVSVDLVQPAGTLQDGWAVHVTAVRAARGPGEIAPASFVVID